MSGDGKWIEGLTPDMPTGQAASIALDARLEWFHSVLINAATPSADAEPVHQLRVAVRRLAATLETFADCLAGKKAREAARLLKRVRRAASAARESDVFLETLREWAIGRTNAEKPGVHFLNGQVFAARRDAQAPLSEAVAECLSGWKRSLGRLTTGVRDGKKRLGDDGTASLNGLIARLESQAGAGLHHEPKHLHAVRVAGKKLRYAIELVGDVVSPSLRTDLYPLVEQLQDLLGIENDCQQAVLLLDGLMSDLAAMRPGILPAVRAGINAFRAYHRDRILNQQSAFAEWKGEWARWTASRAAERPSELR